MKADFTRDTFRPSNRFRRVLQQQGRVQIDADWNEQVAIDTYIDETTARDVVGRHGAPCDRPGFAVTGDDPNVPPVDCAPGDLEIQPGRYYVEGILVEIDDPVGLADQDDLPGVGLPTADGRYLAYLDVWEEHLTALERPELREVALGGPDTATRARTVWQVKLASLPDGDACSDFGPDWRPAHSDSSGRLAARAAPTGTVTEPCVIPPGAGFRRLENQLYRVEIHDPSPDGPGKNPTFMWSRDNGSVVLQVESIDNNVVSVVQPARDSVLGFAPGDHVEISDRGRTLRGQPGAIVQLTSVHGTELTVNGWPLGDAPTVTDEQVTTIRRWDSAGPVDVKSGTWLDLEDGVQVQFDSTTTQHYRTGDHWLIPARSADIEGSSTNVGGDVEWPIDEATDEPEFQGRHGVAHHYAPIAILEVATGTEGPRWTGRSDCRRRFPALIDLTHLIFVGGDGQEALPGEQLRYPLEVAVWNGGCAVADAVVRFSTSPGGTLTGGGASGPSIDVPVGPDGIASCTWLLAADWDKPSQGTRATLIDDHASPVGLPIDFTANLSIASQVAYDPTGCVALAGEVTVQHAVHHLAAASSLIVRCGDGQHAMPGDALPQPLEVEVASTCGPTARAQVEFKADGLGHVAGSAAEVLSAGQLFTAVTGLDGRASVFWLLDTAGPPSQRVQVTLLETPDGFVEEPTGVCFTGQLSVASQVEYDGGCQNLATANTVMDALDVLCDNAGLFYVSGDGQEALPNQNVPSRLQVRVGNGAWPVANRKVRFTVTDGGGTVQAGGASQKSVSATTDANGIADVAWTLGAGGRQRVQASLGDAVSEFTVAFNAQFIEAGGGTAPEPGIRVAGVRLNAVGELLNDAPFPVDALAAGIEVFFSDAFDPAAVKDKPVVILTAELAFPEWEGFVGGFMPLVLRGSVRQASDVSILWLPTDGLIGWLAEHVAGAKNRGIERVLARLVLKGNFVWGRDSRVFVDGDSFGAPSGDGRTELLRDESGLLSGDGRRGGDFEMWFWLVA